MKQYIIVIFISISNIMYAANDDILLETIGFLAASNVLITTNGMGAIWDSWITDGYDNEEFEEFILFYQNLIVSTRENLNSLYRYGQLPHEDQETIVDLIEIYDALHDLSRTALKYSYTSKEIDQEAYYRARIEALNKINILFETDFE